MNQDKANSVLDSAMFILGGIMASLLLFMFLLIIDVVEYSTTGTCNMCIILPWLSGI